MGVLAEHIDLASGFASEGWIALEVVSAADIGLDRACIVEGCGFANDPPVGGQTNVVNLSEVPPRIRCDAHVAESGRLQLLDCAVELLGRIEPCIGHLSPPFELRWRIV